MRILAATSLLALATALPAQNKIERFTLPNAIPMIPGWTTQTGTWKILNQQLVYTGASTWGYMTHSKLSGIANSVVDVEVIYPTTAKVVFGGSCARHPGTATGTNFLMTKLQDNGTRTGFDTAWLYERPGGATLINAAAFGTSTKRAVLRTIVKGNQAWLEVDKDMDGIFELKSGVRTFAATINKTGTVGVSAYQDVALDNWKFFEGSMVADTTTKPAIGTTYKMDFEAPLHGGANPRPTPYLGMLSGGNKGIPLGNGVSIPMSFDALLVNSLGFGLSGVLTSKAPKGTISLPIPNNKSLVGLKLWAAAITLGSGRPGGWGSVSNDHGFIIQ